MRHLFFMLLLLAPMAAHADWRSQGIAHFCSPDGSKFELSAIVESSSEGGTITIPTSFKQIPIGIDRLACKVGRHLVTSTVSVFTNAQGECEGSGTVTIDKLNVDAKSLMASQQFNSYCMFYNEPILTRISIIAKGQNIIFRRCFASAWDWDKGFIDEKCKDQILP